MLYTRSSYYPHISLHRYAYAVLFLKKKQTQKHSGLTTKNYLFHIKGTASLGNSLILFYFHFNVYFQDD